MAFEFLNKNLSKIGEVFLGFDRTYKQTKITTLYIKDNLIKSSYNK